MASTNAIASTLQHVTETKLSTLTVQQKRFQEWKDGIDAKVHNAKGPLEQIVVLLEALEEKNNVSTDTEHSCKAIKRFFEQSKYDPSILTNNQLEEWKSMLHTVLDQQETRYHFSVLFSRLVIEWVQRGSVKTIEPRAESDRSDSESSEESFEGVGREEMHEQRKIWESYVFGAKETDTERIEAYLNSLFAETSRSRKLKATPIEQLRENIQNFDSVKPIKFTSGNVKIAIDGLIKADLFGGEKRKALLDLKNQDIVLKEVADVLNADFQALSMWRWESAVALEMRKQINGKYRIYMDEELYQAIFLQFIGSQWAVHLKESFLIFFNSGAWLQSAQASLSAKDIRRREYFLGSSRSNEQKQKSLRNKRRALYSNRYFMTQLPSTLKESSRDYGEDQSEDESEAFDFGPSGDGMELGENKSPLAVKQSILHLISTELLIQRHIYDQFAVFQSDFKWFGPSIPHSTLFAVLEYLCFTEKWINFFRRFLEAPLYFVHDGSNAEIRPRKRGIPLSHILSDALGETLLFVLDFAVNKKTNGTNLLRFHDDLHFFGTPEACLTAWKEIRRFADIMGLELSEEKTGSIVISGKDSGTVTKAQKDLPKGSVRWGFLTLDSSGEWQVDQEQVEVHVKEMKRQLSTCESVFRYVQCYNTYLAKFFTNNLGRIHVCLGQSHLEKVISTISYIQQSLFSDLDKSDSASSNIADFLRRRIETNEKLHVPGLHIPDGFFYFPVVLGGLQVQNPLIPLLLKRRLSDKDHSDSPAAHVELAFAKNEEDYERAKERHKEGKITDRPRNIVVPVDDVEDFMSLEEFQSAPEERNPHLKEAFDTLMDEIPDDDVVELFGAVKEDFAKFPKPHPPWMGELRKSQASLWTLQLYGEEVLNLVGRVTLGERELLPLGLVEAMKSEKVRWQG